MSTKTIKLRKTLIILVSVALLLAPNLIAFADDTPTGEQGTPTPEVSAEVSAEPTESQAPEESPSPSADPSEEPTETPAPPANAPEATQTEESTEETPSPAPSEQPSEEPTETPAPLADAPETTQAEETPSPDPSEEPTPPANAPEATATPTDATPTPALEALKLEGSAKGIGDPPSGTTAKLTIKNVEGDKNYTVTYTYGYWYYDMSGMPWDWGWEWAWEEYTKTKSPGSSFDVKKGSTVTITANADTSDHYVFVKWKTPSTTANPVSFTMPNSDYTVKAKFQKTHYELELKNSFNLNHYVVNYGSGDITVNVSGHSDTIPVPNGASVSVVAYADSGYEFKSWDESPGSHSQNPTTFTMNDNHSVRADFQRTLTNDLTFVNVNGLDEYTYTWTWRHSWDILGLFARSGNGSANGGQTKSFYKDAKVTVSASALSGYTHTGWAQPSSSSAPTMEITLSSDKTVEATFSLPQAVLQFHYVEGLASYTCTANGNPVAVTTPTPGTPITTVSVPAGSNVVVGATALGTHSLNGWETSDPYDGSGVNPAVSEQTYDFKAMFTRTHYTLSLVKGNSAIANYTVEYTGYSDTHGTEPVFIPINKEVTVTANPTSGKVFDYWDGGCTPPTSGRNGNKWTFTMDSDHWLKAYGDQLAGEKFQIKYEDMLGSGSGNVKVYYPVDTYYTTLTEGQSVDITYQTGKTKVKVEAVPSTDSKFVKWTNYGVTTPAMIIDLVTGQGSEEGAKCYVTIYIKVKPEFEKVGSLTITKKDKNTGNVLPGAVFELRNSANSLMTETGSGTSDGTFYWGSLPEGIYTLTETQQPTGYKMPSPNVWTVKIGADGGISTGAKCVQDKWHVSAEITNEPDHCSLTVTKVDRQGATIAASATFRLTGPNNYSNEQESSTGIFFWGNLVPGDYTLTEISAPSGYYWQTNPHNITLTAGQEGTKNVTNYEYAKVTVKKLDQSGDPLTGATFTLGGIAGTETSPGVYVWENLEAGTYLLDETGVPDGYYITGSSSQNVTVSYGDDKVVEVTNYEYAKVTVKKLDHNGDPLTGATFTLGGIAGTETSPGVYVWENLEAGTYLLDETGVPDGYYITGSSSQNVTVTYGDDKVIEVTNNEYVSIQVQKKSKLTGEPLQDAVFMISEDGTDLGTATSGPNGIATFAYDEFLLKANVEYKVREINPPTGYLNDSDPVYITVSEPGGINPLSAGIFENTPYLHALTVVKYFEQVLVNDIGGGFLDGLEFELFMYDEGSWVSQGTKALLNGTCEFANLLPGDYKIVELGTGNDFAQYMTLDGDKEVTIELVNESTNRDVEFFNSYVDAAFTIIKRDSQNHDIVLEGAIYHLKGMMWNGSGFEEHTYVLETDEYGIASVENLTPGMYTLQEVQAPPHYDIDPNIYDVEILPGRSVEEVYYVENDKLAKLVLAKFQSGTGNQTRIFGAVFSLYRDSEAPANLISQKTTDPNGNIIWDDLKAGNYVLVEDSAPSGFTIVQRSYSITLDIGEYEEILVYNDGSTPTPTPPTNPPESTPTPTPSPTPTPVPTATPTPVNTEEITIEDIDPAFGPETGEGNGLFMTIGILLLMASALFIIRKKAVLKSK